MFASSTPFPYLFFHLKRLTFPQWEAVYFLYLGRLFFDKLLYPPKNFGCITLHKVVKSICNQGNVHNIFSVSCAQKGQPLLMRNREGMTFLHYFPSSQGAEIVCLPRKIHIRDIKNIAGNGHFFSNRRIFSYPLSVMQNFF